jgi:hypothetical protein
VPDCQLEKQCFVAFRKALKANITSNLRLR